jgi:predicted flap endonuclease-1-like 5' DNA nuclease
MIKPLEISYLIIEYLGIFILMFSTFLIGYFSSWWMQKNKYKGKIKRLKRRIKNLIESNKVIIQNKNINDIETVFTEVRPTELKIIKESKEEQITRKTKKTVAEKARTSYITYTKTKPKLNFENFGEASIKNREELTKIEGIGPYVEQKLNEIGIFNYDQISKFTVEDIRVITELIDFFPDRIERDDWVGQATDLKVK